MPSFIPATGRTQHVAGVCLNRIGKVGWLAVCDMRMPEVLSYRGPLKFHYFSVCVGWALWRTENNKELDDRFAKLTFATLRLITLFDHNTATLSKDSLAVLRSGAVPANDQSVSVMLDFVHPIRPRRRLVSETSARVASIHASARASARLCGLTYPAHAEGVDRDEIYSSTISSPTSPARLVCGSSVRSSAGSVTPGCWQACGITGATPVRRRSGRRSPAGHASVPRCRQNPSQATTAIADHVRDHLRAE
jgi:hypothetical protein